MRLAYAGTPDFAVPALQALAAHHHILAVYTQPDRPAGRGRQLAASPVKRAALTLGLPVFQPATLKTDDARRELQSLNVDLMIVAAYGQILPQAVLDAPKAGCINIHASLLPRWRGAAPIQRAILAGDPQTGIALMRMEAGLDTGPVLLERSTPIGPRETAGELEARLAVLGAQCIADAVIAIAQDTIEATPQRNEAATYARKLEKTEARIDWTQPAKVVDRAVRAFNPRPVAETLWRGQQLRLWRARPVEIAPVDSSGAVAPGTVIAADAQGIVVKCGEDALAIEQLQLPGKQPVSAAEFLAGHDLRQAILGVP